MKETDAPVVVDWPAAGVCRLRLNNPERLNALSTAMIAALRDGIETAVRNAAGIVLLIGAGRAFCAGADLKERRTLDEAAKFTHNRAIAATADALAEAPMPTLAAINGLALGGGCELALACDMRIAARSASIGLTEARLGAIPGAGGTQRLPRLIGTGRAFQMMYGGEPVDTGTALDWGLVNTVFEDDRLDNEAIRFASLVASRSRRAASFLKRTVRQGIERTLAEGLELERQAVMQVLASEDYAEGLAAFAMKRPPAFNKVRVTDEG